MCDDRELSGLLLQPVWWLPGIENDWKWRTGYKGDFQREKERKKEKNGQKWKRGDASIAKWMPCDITREKRGAEGQRGIVWKPLESAAFWMRNRARESVRLLFFFFKQVGEPGDHSQKWYQTSDCREHSKWTYFKISKRSLVIFQRVWFGRNPHRTPESQPNTGANNFLPL